MLLKSCDLWYSNNCFTERDGIRLRMDRLFQVFYILPVSRRVDEAFGVGNEGDLVDVVIDLLEIAEHRDEVHSVRGGDKTPGEFRISQNWIGGAGSTLKNARYIPPNPQDMAECMSALEKFMNDEDGMDPLVKAALIHYQFETIHPFLDGNGRVGRLLITLFLMSANELSSPVLYLSCFLKLN